MNNTYSITGEGATDSLPHGLAIAGLRLEGMASDQAAPMRLEAI